MYMSCTGNHGHHCVSYWRMYVTPVPCAEVFMFHQRVCLVMLTRTSFPHPGGLVSSFCEEMCAFLIPAHLGTSLPLLICLHRGCSMFLFKTRVLSHCLLLVKIRFHLSPIPLFKDSTAASVCSIASCLFGWPLPRAAAKTGKWLIILPNGSVSPCSIFKGKTHKDTSKLDEGWSNLEAFIPSRE